MRTDFPKIEVIDDDMAAILRAKSETERLQMGFAMWESARSMIRAVIAAENPTWTTEQIDRAVAHWMSHGAI
ncbi:MAG: hypothetical protein U0903_13390 [Planctomycetales bacterium]